MTETIAIVNEKGGTGKTTTAVNLSAALGELGRKVLLVDLDGQAASSRWLGIEDDTRFADALWRGEAFEPIPEAMPGVALAPGSGKLDSVAHDLRPTQGGQLRKVLSLLPAYDHIIIDCPPSLGNRLIGNALLAATHAIVPVEASILALDGLRILLTTFQDVRDGFGHDIILRGVLACRYDHRTRLSRLVLAELNRSLPGRVFHTVVRENVRMRECPGSGKSILVYAPDSHAAEDYRALAKEVLSAGAERPANAGVAESLPETELSEEERQAILDIRGQVNSLLRKAEARAQSSAGLSGPDAPSEAAEAAEVTGLPEATQEAEPAETAEASEVHEAAGTAGVSGAAGANSVTDVGESTESTEPADKGVPELAEGAEVVEAVVPESVASVRANAPAGGAALEPAEEDAAPVPAAEGVGAEPAQTSEPVPALTGSPQSSAAEPLGPEATDPENLPEATAEPEPYAAPAPAPAAEEKASPKAAEAPATAPADVPAVDVEQERWAAQLEEELKTAVASEVTSGMTRPPELKDPTESEASAAESPLPDGAPEEEPILSDDASAGRSPQTEGPAPDEDAGSSQSPEDQPAPGEAGAGEASEGQKDKDAYAALRAVLQSMNEQQAQPTDSPQDPDKKAPVWRRLFSKRSA